MKITDGIVSGKLTFHLTVVHNLRLIGGYTTKRNIKFYIIRRGYRFVANFGYNFIFHKIRAMVDAEKHKPHTCKKKVKFVNVFLIIFVVF